MTAALATIAVLCLIAAVALTVRTVRMLGRPGRAPIEALTNQVYALVFAAVFCAIAKFLVR